MDAFIVILTAFLVASSTGILGNFLILRKSIMIADAISHAVLPGLVIGFLISGSKQELPMQISAAITGFVCTFLIHLVNKSGKLPKDASIGFIFTLLFAIGIILVSVYTANIDLDPDCVIYGELGLIFLEKPLTLFGFDTVPATTWISLVLALAVAIFTYLFYNQLFISSFDKDFSYTRELNTSLWEVILMGLLSATCVISFNSVGAILVIGFMVIPSAAAYLLTKSLKRMIFLTLFLSLISCIGGYFLTLIIDSSLSSAIICCMSVCFIISVGLNISKK